MTHKLIILIGPIANTAAFSDGWPEFLHHAEEMPGLKSEVTANIETTLFGDHEYRMIHELHFATSQDIQSALASPQGRIAGQVLQKVTEGDLQLIIAEHKEDTIENLRKYKQESANADTP